MCACFFVLGVKQLLGQDVGVLPPACCCALALPAAVKMKYQYVCECVFLFLGRGWQDAPMSCRPLGGALSASRWQSNRIFPLPDSGCFPLLCLLLLLLLPWRQRALTLPSPGRHSLLLRLLLLLFPP